ncbi:MAG: ABC transporter permease [Acidobacteria bacterium]|nr:MAG: ABC transporter permease [Acidobacteriota bacterium]
MLWARRFWLKLQSLFRRKRNAQQLDDEIQFHLEQQILENIAAGMSREEARYAAMRTFGNPTVLKEEARDTWGWIGLEQMGQSLRLSVRALARTPGFALAAIFIIALGIGAPTALFTVVRSVLLRPLPFKEPQRLVRLYEHSADDKFPYNVVSGGVFAEWKRQNHGFSDLAILKTEREYNLSGSGGQLPERVAAGMCSWNLFPMLGVAPALGRNFTAADDQPSSNATVILSWGLWKRRFGSDPALLNQTIRLDAKPYTVLGILPPWFAYPDQTVQLWTPIYHEESPELMQALDDHEFAAIGRLKPGVTAAQATAELSVIVRGLHDQHLDNPLVGKAAHSRPLLESMVGDVKTALYVLLGATGCLLLIACLNVVSLLVARGATRQKELAIRAALGGSRWRLLGEHLTESTLLACAGGMVGLLFAYTTIQWLVATRPDMSRVEAVRMDGIVAVFTFALVFFCALFAGVTSSFSLTTNQLLSSLQESSRSHSAGHARLGLRKGLLSVEVCLTVVLLIASGLLLKSYEQIRSSKLGCMTKNVLTMSFKLPEAQYSKPVQRVSFWERVLQRVRNLPGVRAAGLIYYGVPGDGYGGDGGFTIAEHPPLPQGQYAIQRWADPGYFSALGIPFLSGRTFRENQRLDKANEVIISASFARKYFGSEDPIGKHLLRFGRESYQVVGIVGDTRYLIVEEPEPMTYFPLYSGTRLAATLAVRADGNVVEFALPIQKIVQQLDAELPVADILTMDQIIRRSTTDVNFDATLLLAFAALSLVLAAVGLFGVVAYIGTQRTTEIGVRIALGAQRGEVFRLMIWHGLRPAAMGLAIGLVGGAAAARIIRTLLHGVHPLDAPVFAAVTITLLAVAGAACVLPAWRASRLDPMQALRSE